MAGKGRIGGCLHDSRAAQASGPAARADTSYILHQRLHFSVVRIDFKFVFMHFSVYREFKPEFIASKTPQLSHQSALQVRLALESQLWKKHIF